MITFDLPNQTFTLVTNPKSGVTSTHRLLTDILQEDFKRHDGLNSTRLFPEKETVFVFRDPYERVVSMFFRFNRVIWTDPTGVRRRGTLDTLKEYGKEEGFTFEEFLSYLRNTSNQERDIHYRAQDIPDRCDYVVRTHQYYEDLLAAFRAIGYANGVERLAARTAADVVANSVKKGARRSLGNVLALRTMEFERFEKEGYPPYELFLNADTRRVIETIFKEEIEWNCRFSS